MVNNFLVTLVMRIHDFKELELKMRLIFVLVAVVFFAITAKASEIGAVERLLLEAREIALKNQTKEKQINSLKNILSLILTSKVAVPTHFVTKLGFRKDAYGFREPSAQDRDLGTLDLMELLLHYATIALIGNNQAEWIKKYWKKTSEYAKGLGKMAKNQYQNHLKHAAAVMKHSMLDKLVHEELKRKTGFSSLYKMLKKQSEGSTFKKVKGFENVKFVRIFRNTNDSIANDVIPMLGHQKIPYLFNYINVVNGLKYNVALVRYPVKLEINDSVDVKDIEALKKIKDFIKITGLLVDARRKNTYEYLDRMMRKGYFDIKNLTAIRGEWNSEFKKFFYKHLDHMQELAYLDLNIRSQGSKTFNLQLPGSNEFYSLRVKKHIRAPLKISNAKGKASPYLLPLKIVNYGNSEGLGAKMRDQIESLFEGLKEQYKQLQIEYTYFVDLTKVKLENGKTYTEEYGEVSRLRPMGTDRQEELVNIVSKNSWPATVVDCGTFLGSLVECKPGSKIRYKVDKVGIGEQKNTAAVTYVFRNYVSEEDLW